MTNKEVAGLVAQARNGSAEARDELVRRYYRDIAAIAATLVNDATEGEDLAQEAFIRAFRNLDLLVDPERFSAWLRRIVVGVSIDWLRAFRPSLYRGWTDADDSGILTPEPTPLDLTLRAEVVERVRAALARLPPRYRVPLSLYHLDGLSHTRISAALDVPVGTVRSLVARARKKLAPFLSEFAPDAVPPIDDLFAPQAMMTGTRARFLHVANGTATTRTIEAAGIPGLRSIWADPLHDGPVPDLNDDALVEVRRRHLSGEGGERSTVWAGPDLSQDPVNDLREWRAMMLRHNAYEELVLWFEHDVFDQLNLIQVLTWIREHLPRALPVSLICIGSFPGRPTFKGLGELTPDELASLFETRQRVNERQYEIARRAWQAFRAPTPEALDALRHDDTAALPYLVPAISRFLQEYPSTRNGLSRTEQRLLELADGGGIALEKALPRMHDGEQVYYVTDTSVAELAEALARTGPPLLRLDLSRPETGSVLPGVVTLTDTGGSVLSGSLDRVATCGIDKWLGGVHLGSSGRLWRWDDTHHRIVPGEGGMNVRDGK